MTQKPAPLCAYCGKEIVYSGRGRRPQYCSQACRQRAYEKRIGARQPARIPLGSATGTSDTLGQERLNRLKDSLFELRCAAEDIEIAVQEGADAAEVVELCHELVARARAVEQIT